MKKLFVFLVITIAILTASIGYAAPKNPPYIVTSSDCSWLTFYGVLCHDSDDGKIYKWSGAAQVELATAAGDGDIESVWQTATGAVTALTAGAGDSLNATSADYSIPFVVGADCSGVTAEGRACWDSDDNILYIGNGAAAQAVGTASGALLANGTVPLTADWDAGSYEIRAQTFESDVATGTAPLVVASTTEVANLRSATATALAANGANCDAGSAPRGVDASGAVENCTAYQASDATLTALAGLTIADVSVIEGTGADAMAVVTSGGALRYLRSNSDNSALEFSATVNGSAIDIHGTTAETTVADADEILIYSNANSGNRMMTKGNFVAGITSSGIVLDLADDGSNESTSVNEIATSTASAIFSEPSANKLYIDLAQPWPTATLASTVTVVDSTDSSSYIAMFDSATGSLAAKTDAGITYNASTGVLTATGFAGPITGAVTGNVTGNAATATALASNPTDCGANEYATAIAANGNLTCSQPASTALSDTATLGYLAGTNTWTGNNTFGNANSDVLTVQSTIVGSGRAVTIDADGTTSPSYATATDSLFVTSHIETAGNVYASSFVGGAGTDTQRRVGFTSNTSLDCATYPDSLYYVSDAFYWCESTAAKTPMKLQDAQTATGVKTFQGGAYFGDASNNNGTRFYDGSSNYWTVVAPTGMSTNPTFKFPSAQGASGTYLYDSDGAGTLAWGTPTATAHGSDTYVQFNDGGTALGSDADFTYNKTTARLKIGSDGTGGGLVLHNELGATDYTATIVPNASQAADATITLPAATGTLAVLAANTFTGNQTAPAFVPNSAANAAGEMGYASNAFSWFANSEDMVATASANLWTFSSGTDATFAFTPAVAFTASASIGTAITPDTADGATLGTSALEWSDLYLADGGVIYFQNDQSVYLTPSAGTLTLTGALVTSGAVSPSAAGGAALGSATAEWDHLYLHDSAVIYGQADQSNTMTSSATGWNLNKPLGLLASDDPDVATTGAVAFDTDGWLRVYNNSRQEALARTQEEIHVTVYKPQDLDDAQRDHFWIWSNESGMSFIVTGWKGWSTSDDTTLTIYEEDADGANDATVDAVEIATGAGPYTGSDTTITGATIENGHLLYLDFDDTDAPAMVKITIYGYYNADVN